MYSATTVRTNFNKLHSKFKYYMSYSTTIYDYQYIQKSKIPTLHFQLSLPRLPIPKLEKTCERYLEAQKPLLINEAYNKTEANVAHFKNSSGKTLQDILMAKDKKNKLTSYISEPWFDMYLRDRKPLPINYNPVLVYEDEQRQEYNSQLVRSTNMLVSSLRFMRSLRKGILEPEVFHLNPKKSDTAMFRNITSTLPKTLSWYGAYMFNAYPLDMSQYSNLFGTSRIPEMDKDWLHHDPNAKHITVMHKGHIYYVQVLDNAGNILPANVLLARLKHILRTCPSPVKYPIGILTTEDRDVWASVRHHLSQIGNETNLKLIDLALFNLVLDDEEVAGNPVKVTRHFMHADGNNRWFDKSFSLIFSKDGVGGVNFEHSWGDGVAVLRYFQDIFKDAKEQPQVHLQTTPDETGIDTGIKLLDIQLDDRIKQAVNDAQSKYKKKCESLEMKFLISDNMGKNFLKKKNVSPDAIMQLGFQAAYYKLQGKVTASYESCSTSAFKHGRTETIRPCTMMTKTYCEAVNSAKKPSDAELYKIIQDCSKKHMMLSKEAVMGQGFDRHLFVLKYLAEKEGMPMPIIFEDPAYSAINYNIISTSTLSSPVVQSGGFGPVVPDGYGIGYMIRDEELGTLVTSYKPYADAAQYIDALNTSYDEIQRILHK